MSVLPLRKEFTVNMKTNNGLVTWIVYASDIKEAREKAVKEVLEQMEINDYKVTEIKEEKFEE